MKHILFSLALLLACISENHAQFWAKSNGRFGIGDENAYAKLQVNANSSFANPGIALLDSSATNTSGGILQFRSINYDDNHFNIQAKIGEFAYGQDSKLDFFWRDNLIMSIEGGTNPDRQLIYNPRDGIFRTGYLNNGVRGHYSVAMGYNNLASGFYSVALGIGNQALTEGCTALGGNSIAESTYSTVIGYGNYASGPFSLAAGKQCSALEINAVAIGDSAVASGASSHAIGYKTLASAHSSTATGHLTDATGLYSFSGGYNTQATNTSSTSFGFYSQATGVSATSLGYATLAAGENSIALNSVTKAFGNNSLSSGYDTKAYGWESSAFGNNTTTRSYVSAVFGAYNDTIATSTPDGWVDDDALFMIGNGLSNTERNNALAIYKDGNLVAKSKYIVNSDPGAIPLPVSGPGTRMMWIPEKSAFRAGTVYDDAWDTSNLGAWSVAGGYNAKATHSYDVAFGYFAEATGGSSLAAGYNPKALGAFSVALGNSNIALGNWSLALGSSSVAGGTFSTSMGWHSQASGEISTSMGTASIARAYGSTAIGSYNDSLATSSPTSWVDTDPLFMIGNGTSEATRHNAITIYKNGNLLAKHPSAVITDPGSLPTPVSGAGTRMMWLPEKSAFRVGTVNGTQWNSDNIGTWSIGLGQNAKATGNDATAIGPGTQASNDYTTAIGTGAWSTGFSSVAIGDALAIGDYSLAMGQFTGAEAPYSMAAGYFALATGYASTGIGSHVTALGSYSFALGRGTESKAFYSTAAGCYNNGIESSNETSWVSTDPIFYVGNGEDGDNRSNAMVVYKNGNTDINGYTRLGEATESAPKIKMKELPLSLTGPTYNSFVNIPHGLSVQKILSVSVLVQWDLNSFVPPEYSPSLNLRYNYYITGTDIVIQNNTPSGDCLICDQFVKVLITYKE